MKALDTNVIIRFLMNDDKAQAGRVKAIFELAEKNEDQYFVTTPVILETIWVLSAVYEFTRDEILHALELLTEMPILAFENYESLRQVVALGRNTKADIPDLLIGLSGKTAGCETTLTFEKGLEPTGLFERIGAAV
jgi:predicted nucleic-acid-binding protein